jgi:hypothetical protein
MRVEDKDHHDRSETGKEGIVYRSACNPATGYVGG